MTLGKTYWVCFSIFVWYKICKRRSFCFSYIRHETNFAATVLMSKSSDGFLWTEVNDVPVISGSWSIFRRLLSLPRELNILNIFISFWRWKAPGSWLILDWHFAMSKFWYTQSNIYVSCLKIHKSFRRFFLQEDTKFYRRTLFVGFHPLTFNRKHLSRISSSMFLSFIVQEDCHWNNVNE